MQWSPWATEPRGLGNSSVSVNSTRMGRIDAYRECEKCGLGSPATINKMLEFCTRHDIAPQIELFPMSKVNEAMAHLKAGKARYRIVLENDF